MPPTPLARVITGLRIATSGLAEPNYLRLLPINGRSEAAFETAFLAFAAYVDLNPIRASMAETPEQGEYTSMQRRIQSLLPGNGESAAATSETSPPKEEFSDYLDGVVILTAIGAEKPPEAVSSVSVQSQVTPDRFFHQLRWLKRMITD